MPKDDTKKAEAAKPKDEKKKSDSVKPKDEKKKQGDPAKPKEDKKDSGKSKDEKKKSDSGKKSRSAAGYGCYVNREMSWLEFNLRVLQEAADHSVPLLERLKFLGIYQSNLDEFFRVRVGIMTHRDKLMPNQADPMSGWVPAEQIRQILTKTASQQTLAETVWKVLKEELKNNGIDVLDFRKIPKIDELMSKKLFGDLRSVLLPQIIRANQPLPFLWDGESYVLATLGRGPDTRYALIPLHRLPAYMSFELNGRQKIILTPQLVRHFLPVLMKKEEIRDSAVVKVTRNADVFIEENRGMIEDDDFRRKMENMLKKRKRELPVRLQINGKLQASTRAWLLKQLGVSEHSVFDTTVPYDLSFRSTIPAAPGFTYEPRKPARDIGLKKGEYFSYIEKQDLLLSLPFQSMMPVVDLLYEAADDPDVLSIKITLYRLAASSKVAAALAYAADRGKDVLCLLELRARFDEQNNIDYSEMLEDAGCRVIYGLPEQKVHSKLCVITRQKDGNLSHITQVGTGNYNEVTGEQYTDLHLFTADEQAAADAEAAFNALVLGEFPPGGEKLWVAPLGYKRKLLDLLDREIAKGEDGRVAIKVNSVNDREVMEKLIRCSRAGVKVELFVRGICCLRPGIPGETENITVKSVVGRWLEHSRIFQFGEGADERLFIGSGDLLSRNTDRRVEAFIEAVTPDTREQLKEILDALRNDREKGRLMQSDGTYIREEGGAGTSSQEALYWYFSQRKVKWPKEPEEEVPAEENYPEEPEAVIPAVPLPAEEPAEEIPAAQASEEEPAEEIPAAQTSEEEPAAMIPAEEPGEQNPAEETAVEELAAEVSAEELETVIPGERVIPAADDFSEELTEEMTEELTEDLPEETAGELTEDLAEETSEEPAEELPEEMAGEAAEEPAEEVPEELTGELAEEAAEELTEDLSEKMTEELTEDLEEELTGEPAEELAEEMAEEPAEDMPEELTGEPAEELPEELREEPTEDLPESEEEFPLGDPEPVPEAEQEAPGERSWIPGDTFEVPEVEAAEAQAAEELQEELPAVEAFEPAEAPEEAAAGETEPAEEPIEATAGETESAETPEETSAEEPGPAEDSAEDSADENPKKRSFLSWLLGIIWNE